jgi:hypothetical protein
VWRATAVGTALVFVFLLAVIFLTTRIEWAGQILDEVLRLCLLAGYWRRHTETRALLRLVPGRSDSR